MRMRPPVDARRPFAGDDELVARVVAGQRECFADLVRRHQTDLYRYARGMGGDHDTALDLVQDTFIRAYQSIASCRDRARFRFWLLRILRNRCLDHFRGTDQRSVPLDALGAVSAPGATPELKCMIDEALALLPPGLREAFVLKHVEQLSYEEMTEVTGASQSALKMRVHRARELLRSALDGVSMLDSM